MLLGPYARVYDEVHIFSPSVEVDSAWDVVREFAKGLKTASFHSNWDEPALLEALERQKRKIRELKAAKTEKPLPQVLVVIDDFADRWDIMRNAQNVLTTCFIRGRHAGVSCWLSSQKLTAISTVARVSFRFLCVWRLRNQKELVSLLEELSAVHPVPVLHQMYEQAVSDEPHSFWFLNLVKSKEEMFHVRFEHRQIVDDTPPEELLAQAPRDVDSEPAHQL